MTLHKSPKQNKTFAVGLQSWLLIFTHPPAVRASTFLVMAAQAKCLLNEKSTPDISDIQSIAKPVLRHRIITNFTAEADGVSKEDILDQLIEKSQS